MDGAQLRILFVFTDLILPLLVGYYLHQRKLISDKTCTKMINFNIVIIYTILSILSFWVLPLTWQLIWLPLLGVLFCLVPGLFGLLTFAKSYKNYLDRGSYLLCAILSNIGMLGGLCAFILYGEIGFAYAQMISIFQTLVLLLVCFPLAQYYYELHTASTSQNKLQFNLRSVLISWNQLPVAGMAVGILLYLGDVPRPQAMGTIFDSLVHISAWIALLPVGYLIDFSAAKQYYRRVIDLIPLKFVITPLIFYFIISHLFTDQILLGTIMIQALTPTAINAIITARLFKLNVDLTVAAFILTTIIYICLVFPLIFFYVTTGHTL